MTFAADPTLRVAKEAQEMIDLLAGVHLLLNHGNRLREVQPLNDRESYMPV